jgi:hypothetical protein
MSEFLEYLNSADEEALLKIEGMPKTLAKRLIDARPMASSEDFLKVKGMSVKLFSTLQTGFLEFKENKIEEALEHIEDEEKESEQPAQKTTKVWVKILRATLIILIILGAAYAAIIYGVPYIYETFLKPVESNTARLNEIAASQSADTKLLNENLIALTDRVATLETRADAVDESIAGLTASIDNLTILSNELDASVNYRVTLTRSIDYLSRSRLYLSQDNNGLARADVVSARNLLAQLSASAPANQTYAMNEAINNLDLALSNLPAYPAVAVYYVDIAWQYLVDGLNATQPTVLPLSTVPTEVTAAPETTVAVTPAP